MHKGSSYMTCHLGMVTPFQVHRCTLLYGGVSRIDPSIPCEEVRVHISFNTFFAFVGFTMYQLPEPGAIITALDVYFILYSQVLTILCDIQITAYNIPML